MAFQKTQTFVDLDREEPYFIAADLHRGTENFTVRHTWFPPNNDGPVPTKKGIVVQLEYVPKVLDEMVAVYNKTTGSNLAVVEYETE